jgi:restriction system protein
MTNIPSMQLAPAQEEFLNKFLGRNDERTLLVAAAGMGKSVTSNIAATRMLARGLVDRVFYVAPHRGLVDQWQSLLQKSDLGRETAIESMFAATTYAALARDLRTGQ